MKHNQIIGPGKNNYGRGWKYLGPNMCLECGKPARPREVENFGGKCNICHLVELIKKRKMEPEPSKIVEPKSRW